MKIKSPRTKSIVNEGKIDMIKWVLTKILNKIEIKVEKKPIFFQNLNVSKFYLDLGPSI